MNVRLVVALSALAVACGHTGPNSGGGGGGGGAGAGGSGGAGTGGGSAAGGGAHAGGGASAGGGTGGGSSSCDGLSEDACIAASGCVVDWCFTCTCSPVYLGCRAPSELAHMCPPVGCASPTCCSAQSDCMGFAMICLAPGQQLGCGVCMAGGGNCTADTDCASGQICEPIACSCDGSKACTAGCNNDCGQGTVCSGGAHPRCVAQACSGTQPCPRGFTCTNSACERKTCTLDGGCDPSGLEFCVDGACYDSMGTCETMPQ